MGQAALFLPGELVAVIVLGGMAVGIAGSIVSLGRVRMW
jgi:hypothetical protein